MHSLATTMHYNATTTIKSCFPSEVQKIPLKEVWNQNMQISHKTEKKKKRKKNLAK